MQGSLWKVRKMDEKDLEKCVSEVILEECGFIKKDNKMYKTIGERRYIFVQIDRGTYMYDGYDSEGKNQYWLDFMKNEIENRGENEE